MKKELLLLFAFLYSFTSFSQEFKAAEIRKHIEFLASDKLEGRGTGTQGEMKAADYLADIFKKAGLKPVGTDGTFLQPFKVTISFGGSVHPMTGRNVIGFLDNGAEKTIVVGGHYDHLGKGFQSGSLTPDSQNQIHNGADDNASGTTGVIELAEYFAGNNIKEKHNLLFIAFSGEELGLLGSKYFTENPSIPLNSVSCMINMDMIGRLDDAKGIIVSGWGTSPVWGKVIPDLAVKQKIRYTVDSSGIGASDHTSFYLKDIPVVQFFTGVHGDYHKLSDDADKINFDGESRILSLIARTIEGIDKETNEPEFTIAADPHAGRTTSNFKVTLGVMPDYSFSGKGLRIDAVSTARPAANAGIEAGDVIIKLAGKDISTIYDYMDILGDHEKGQTVEAEFLRNNEKKTVKVTF